MARSSSTTLDGLSGPSRIRHRSVANGGDAMRPGAVSPVEALSGGTPSERPGRGIGSARERGVRYGSEHSNRAGRRVVRAPHAGGVNEGIGPFHQRDRRPSGATGQTVTGRYLREL
jgi:hypothetical protein